MRFIKRLLEPSYLREANFDSLVSKDNSYRFDCSVCTAIVTFRFPEIIGKEYSWRSEYPDKEVEQVESYFPMNLVGKSPDGGWPAILEASCDNCGAEFMVYAGVSEIYNSVHRVTVQSIAEISHD